MFSRKTIIGVVDLLRFTTHKDVDRFSLRYGVEDHMTGQSIRNRVDSLMKHLLVPETDKKIIEEIVTDTVNEELELIEEGIEIYGLNYETFESKHPKLFKCLKEDGFSIVDNRLHYRNVTEVVHLNKQKKLVTTFEGEGSYAHVYSYFDPHYNQTFALKRAKKELTDKELIRFKNEYTELSKLDSPYIVKVYCYNDEKAEYTMEFIKLTLYKYIVKNNTKITLSIRISIIQQIFKAFIYIHSKGLLHRDISASNVLIQIHDDGTIIAKISDFGLVKIPESSLTDPDSSLKGSLNDSSLAIIGFGKYEVRHEVFALTQLVNFVLTGHTKGGLYDKNQEIHDYLSKGLDSDINKRFANIKEMAREFSRLKHLIN